MKTRLVFLMFTERNLLSCVSAKNDEQRCITFTPITQNTRKLLKDHLENPVLTFSILRGERDIEKQTSPALLPVPFLLIADVHQLPYYPSLFPKPQRVLSCGPSSRVTAVCCFWTAQYYCLAQVLVSDSEVVAGKCEPCPKLSHEGLACSQRKIGSAWWSMSSSLSGRNKKWFSLFLFHPAVLQLRSQWSEAVLFVFERCSLLTRVIFFACCLFVVSFCVWGCIACFEVNCMRSRGSSGISGGLLWSK